MSYKGIEIIQRNSSHVPLYCKMQGNTYGSKRLEQLKDTIDFYLEHPGYILNPPWNV